MDVIALTNSLYWLIGVLSVMALFVVLHETFVKDKFPITVWKKASWCVYLALAFICPALWLALVVVATLLAIASGFNIAAAVCIAVLAAVLGNVLVMFLLRLVWMLIIYLICLPFDLAKKIKRKMKNK